MKTIKDESLGVKERRVLQSRLTISSYPAMPLGLTTTGKLSPRLYPVYHGPFPPHGIDSTRLESWIVPDSGCLKMKCLTPQFWKLVPSQVFGKLWITSACFRMAFKTATHLMVSDAHWRFKMSIVVKYSYCLLLFGTSWNTDAHRWRQRSFAAVSGIR